MADINEVIDLMVANKEPHEDIMKIINDYNKAQKESSTKETVTTPETKEVPAQTGVAVKGDDTASIGEESSTDVVGEIFKVKDSVTKTDKKVTSRAAEKYFDLSKLNRKGNTTGSIKDGTKMTTFENTEEEDLEAYFNSKKSLKAGINKYEEYKKYQKTGELPKNNANFNAKVIAEQVDRQRLLVEGNINKIPKSQRRGKRNSFRWHNIQKPSRFI